MILRLLTFIAITFAVIGTFIYMFITGEGG